MTELATLSHSSTYCIPCFDDGHIESVLEQVICAPQAEESCTDNANANVPVWSSYNALHYLKLLGEVVC